MPTFKVTDPTTGKIVRLTGDSPPTEKELEEVFTSLKEPKLRSEKRRLSLSTEEKIASGILQPALETAGMIGGSLIGIPGGWPGMAFGAGVGGAAGKRAGEYLGEKIFGIPAPQRTLTSELTQTPIDVATFGATELYGPAAKAIAGKVAAPFVRKIPTPLGETMVVPPEGVVAAKLAEQKGVPLTPAAITGSKTLELVESALGYLPGAAGTMHKQNVRQLTSLMKVREDLLNKISEGGSVSPKSLEQVGLDIKTTLDKMAMKAKSLSVEQSLAAKNKILADLGSYETYESLGRSAQTAIAAKSQKVAEEGEALYNRAWEKLGENKIPLKNLQETADRLLKQEVAGFGSLRNKSITNILDDLSGSRLKKQLGLDTLESMPGDMLERNPQLMEQLGTPALQAQAPRIAQKTRSDLNQRIIASDLAYKTQVGAEQKMLSSSEAGIYKQLRGALEKDIKEHLEASGNKEAIEAWDTARLFWKEGKQTFNNDTIRKATRATPDKVIDTAFVPDSPVAIKQLKKALPEKEFNNLSNGFTTKMLDRVSRKEFTWEKLEAELNKYGEQTLKEIYTPAKLSSLRKAIEAGKATKEIPMDQYLEQLLKHASPKTIFNMTFIPNNARNVTKLRNAIDPNLFQEAKRVATEKFLEINEFGFYLPSKGVLKLSKMDEGTLNAIYSKSELKDLQDIIELSKRSMRAEKAATVLKGPVQSIITFEVGKAVLTHPLSFAKYIILPKAMARLYNSSITRKYVTDGFKSPIKSPNAINKFSKLLTALGGNAEEEEIE